MSIPLQEFKQRRKLLADTMQNGLVLLPANPVFPRNYSANPLPFRQDSTFLYYTGIDIPDLFFMMDCQTGESFLAGNEKTIEDAVWSGPQQSLKDIAETLGIESVLSVDGFKNKLGWYKSAGANIHFLPPYSLNRRHILSSLLDIPAETLNKTISEELCMAVVKQRSVKSPAEIAEIESTLNTVTGTMHVNAMKMAAEGNYEYQIVAEMFKTVKANNLEFAYPVICSVRGEILHNEYHENQLRNGQLLLVDAGAESSSHYASDITRTTPVGGRFTMQQREIYEIVLTAQLNAIRSMRPGIRFLDIHMQTALFITRGLIELGLMHGNAGEAVRAGAHALFFPHGLGHLLGLDVHDMEDIGENLTGYDKNTVRSEQFGTAYLRFAKELKAGYVLTVEPGIYFIPALINQWHGQKKFENFINYSALNNYFQFGGIRIEDNILITETGNRILGDSILKSVEEIEALF